MTASLRATATVVRYVVLADWMFTTPTIIIQPLTGFYLIHLAGFPLTSPWIYWSIALYLLAGAAWLPVLGATAGIALWIAMRMPVKIRNAPNR